MCALHVHACVSAGAFLFPFAESFWLKEEEKKNPRLNFFSKDESEVRDGSLFPTAVVVEENNSRPPLSL